MKTKIMFKCDNDLWGKVNDFKVKNSLPNNNEAVKQLLTKGLQKENLF